MRGSPASSPVIPVLCLISLLFVASCSTGKMIVREQHYYAVRTGENTNYYRLSVDADTRLGIAEYRSGWYPAHAVDSVFGDVSADGGAEALEARQKLEKQLRKSILATQQNYLTKAQDPATTEQDLEKLITARRRVLAYPVWEAGPIPGTIEIEYNPAAGIATTHLNDKLIFVLSSDPDEVVGKIANFAESDKTVLSINNLAKVTSQRLQNEIAAEEEAADVDKRLDALIHSQIKKALLVIGDDPRPDSSKQAVAEINTLLRLLESVQ